MRTWVFVLAVAISGVAVASDEFTNQIPDIRLEQVADGFALPVYLAGAGDGRGRMFVVEQAGMIRILNARGDETHPVFLDLRDRVQFGGERGLLSVAFHPDFARNRRLFVNYTTSIDGDSWTHVSEFKASEDLQSADPASERVVLKFRQPYANHNGGHVLFGPDGYLYIGNGDGGNHDDPHNNGQRLDTLLGKILRIDVDRRNAGKLYSIPPDNPFARQAGVRPEIFAYGLRNPWRLCFDRDAGVMYAADVGQNTREEIDVIEKGKNYGWRIMEGNICTPGVNSNCDNEGLVPPILDYSRSDGISVTGGFVYRGAKFPALRGVYLYSDYGSGKVWGLRSDGKRMTSQRQLLASGLPVASFGLDDDGEIYVLNHRGAILHVVPASP